MTKVAVTYHSGFGHTAEQAKAVAQCAHSIAGVTAELVPVGKIDGHWDDLNQADAIVFGAPTYMGSASAPFKAFMDAISKAWFEQKWKNKIAARGASGRAGCRDRETVNAHRGIPQTGRGAPARLGMDARHGLSR